MVSIYRDAQNFFVNASMIALNVEIPMSPWSDDPKLKDAGAFVMSSMMDDMSRMSMAISTRLRGWDPIEPELFLAEVKKEWKSRCIHGCCCKYVFLAQEVGKL